MDQREAEQGSKAVSGMKAQDLGEKPLPHRRGSKSGRFSTGCPRGKALLEDSHPLSLFCHTDRQIVKPKTAALFQIRKNTSRLCPRFPDLVPPRARRGFFEDEITAGF